MKKYRYRLYKVVDGNGDVSWTARLMCWPFNHRIGFWDDLFTSHSYCARDEDMAILGCHQDAHRRRAKSYTIESYKDIQA